MSLTDIRSAAIGLDYVIRQTKNRELAKESIDGLKHLRNQLLENQKANKEDLVQLIDEFIENAQMKVGFHAYDASEIFEEAPDTTQVINAFLIYFAFLLCVSAYVFAVGPINK